MENVVEIPLVTEEMPHDADGDVNVSRAGSSRTSCGELRLVASRSANKICGSILSDYSTPQTIDPFKERFRFADALEIEVARQLHDDFGVPLTEGLRLAAYTMAVRSFLDAQSADSSSDFWLAVTSTCNTWGNEPPGSWPITGFGPKEYWAEMHYVGSLGAIMGDILLSFGQDQVSYPDFYPARIVMTNVSAAYRRLRKRAHPLWCRNPGRRLRLTDQAQPPHTKTAPTPN